MSLISTNLLIAAMSLAESLLPSLANTITQPPILNPTELANTLKVEWTLSNKQMLHHDLYVTTGQSELFSSCSYRHPSSSDATHAVLSCDLQPGLTKQTLLDSYEGELTPSPASAHAPADSPHYLSATHHGSRVSYGYDRSSGAVVSFIIDIPVASAK